MPEAVNPCSLCRDKVVHASCNKDGSTNPKDLVGSAKVAMAYLSAIGRAHAVDAMMDGAGKYGPYNWRDKKITAMNYVHAAIRHLDLWVEGEECADDSQAHHLGHAIATISILLDAQAHGCLIDDRPKSDCAVALKSVHDRVKRNEAARKVRRELSKETWPSLQDKIGILVKGAQSGRIQGRKPNQSGKQKVKK